MMLFKYIACFYIFCFYLVCHKTTTTNLSPHLHTLQHHIRYVSDTNAYYISIDKLCKDTESVFIPQGLIIIFQHFHKHTTF